MARKTKKIPKYLIQNQASISKVYKGGNQNPEKMFSIMVPVLNADGTIKIDDKGVVRVQVNDLYQWNQKHRTRYQSGNGRWTCHEKIEESIFLNCRENGCYCNWKGNKKKGWGVYYTQGQVQVIGQGVSSNNQMIDVKICKFVESTGQHWHGYPIDYRVEKDVICDNALFYWEKLQLIDKSEIRDIKNQEDSSLV